MLGPRCFAPWKMSLRRSWVRGESGRFRLKVVWLDSSFRSGLGVLWFDEWFLVISRSRYVSSQLASLLFVGKLCSTKILMLVAMISRCCFPVCIVLCKLFHRSLPVFLAHGSLPTRKCSKKKSMMKRRPAMLLAKHFRKGARWVI